MRVKVPRLIVAGLSGDSGKTLVTLGLTGAFAARGLTIAPFKKGPDYIDAGWLEAAAGRPGRNLDTFMMGPAAIVEAFTNAWLQKAGDRDFEQDIPQGTNVIAMIAGQSALRDEVIVLGAHYDHIGVIDGKVDRSLL